MAPEQIWKRGHRSGAKVGDRSGAKHRKNFLWGRAPPLFGSKSTISRFGERFCRGQYSMVSSCLLFFCSRCPRAQPFVKVGGTWPPCPMESAPLMIFRNWARLSISDLAVWLSGLHISYEQYWKSWDKKNLYFHFLFLLAHHSHVML